MSEWLTQSPRWVANNDSNLKDILLSERNKIYRKLVEVIEKSSKFPIAFPVETVRCSYLKTKTSPEELENNINSAYPVLHEHALLLFTMFLDYQKRFGNTEFYKDMSLLEFIDRLLSKRAVAFVGVHDYYMLLNGTEGAGNWETVGTKSEKPPLILKDCLSYDEIKLSALLSVSSYTYFVNDGNRRNRGLVEENREKIEENGIIVGLIGARLVKEKVMEYREIVKTRRQNTELLGYGKNSKQPSLQGKFLEFYGDMNATYMELEEQFKSIPDRYINLGVETYFDTVMFERRIMLSIDTLLIEANARAKEKETKAFVHVVGLGLGVWKIWSGQDKLFVDTFAKRMEFLQSNLTNVSDVCFAYITQNMVGRYQNGDKLGDIKIHIRNRNPHDKLVGVDEGKLLVVSYAWDGNALPGNEFWYGNLASSSDPAAACSTQVAELHNFHINKKVCANNLRVATLRDGLVTFEQYQELQKNN